MNQRNKKKSKVLLVSLFLLVCVTVGGTVAYLMHLAGPVVNTFVPSKITTDIVEELDGKVKSNVKVKNTGDTEGYLRAAVVVTWQNAAGEIYGQMPGACTDPECIQNNHKNCNADYEIQYSLVNSGEGWIKSSDGFYYWTKPVISEKEAGNDESKCLTGVLISTCKPLKDAPAEGYYLNVEIIGSGIQSKPTSVVNEKWSGSGLEVGADGTLTQRSGQAANSGN